MFLGQVKTKTIELARHTYHSFRYWVVRETFAVDETFDVFMSSQRKLPTGMFTYLTNICNARCTFCSYPLHADPKGVMSMEVFRKAVDEYVAGGGTSICLTPNNGDPLIDPKIVEKMEYAKANGIKYIELNTNGILLERGTLADDIIRLADAVGVSLPGLESANYKIVYGVDKAENVFRGLRKLIEAKVRIGRKIRVYLDFRIDRPLDDVWRDENMSFIKPYVDRGVVEVESVRCEEMFDWSGLLKEEELTGLMKIKRANNPEKQLPCNRTLTDFNISVLWDGAIRACSCGRGASNYPLVIGNIMDAPLDSFSGNAAHRKLQRDWMKGKIPEGCRTCFIYQPNPFSHKTLALMMFRLLASLAWWRRVRNPVEDSADCASSAEARNILPSGPQDADRDTRNSHADQC